MKLWHHGGLLLLVAASASPWIKAWGMGTISGLSLPFGAILGILYSPVSDEVAAMWMALGAGSLLFAVTVELYAHALRELELGRAGLLELFATVVGALLGALFYLWVNRLLETMMVHEDQDPELGSGSSSTGNTSPVNEKTPLRQCTEPIKQVSRERRSLTPNSNHPSLGFREDSATFSRHQSFSSWAGSDEYIAARTRDRVFSRMAILTSEAASIRGNHGGSPRSDMSLSCCDSDNVGDLSHRDSPETKRKCNLLALQLFLGILVDGVPEGILMGFLAAEGHLSWVLIFSLLVANFPEAFSSASLARQAGESKVKIVAMWGGLCLLVGALSGIACFSLMFFFPSYPHGHPSQGCLLTVSLVEGLTGGAMIACIATVMLPEAFQRSNKHGAVCASSGFLCVVGFILAVVLKALEHHYNNTQGEVPGIYGKSLLSSVGFERW